MQPEEYLSALTTLIFESKFQYFPANSFTIYMFVSHFSFKLKRIINFFFFFCRLIDLEWMSRLITSTLQENSLTNC